MNFGNQFAPFGAPSLLSITPMSTDAEILRPTDAQELHPESHSADAPDPSQPKLRRRFRGRPVQLIYAIIDVCCVLATSALAFAVRFPPLGLASVLSPGHLFGTAHRYSGFFLLEIGLILLSCEVQHLYRTPLERPFRIEAAAIAKAVAISTVLLTTFIYLSGVTIISRPIVVISSALNLIALITWRYAKRRYIVRRIERGIGVRNALIIGTAKVGQALAQLFQNNRLLGYRVIGFIDEPKLGEPHSPGRVANLCRIARAHFVDEIFITSPSDRSLVIETAIAARQHHFAITVIPDLYDGLGWNASLRRIGSFPAVDLHWNRVDNPALALKRLIDICLAGIGLVVTAPVLAVLSLLILRDSRGPVFYRSRRVGQKGREFSCYKLRTMVADAEDQKEALRDRNERDGPFFKITHDPRITPLGKFLRKYSLDELPQLWNVLIGNMSLVGPRPHPVDDCRFYTVDDLRRLEVKPGLTGLWQITARRDPSFQKSVRLDLDYIDGWNLLMDLRILARTLSAVLRAEGC